MIQATIADYVVRMAEGIPEDYGTHAALVERFGLEHTEQSAFYLEVRKGSEWPFLCVVQRYSPDHWAGSHPGILLVPETRILFIGAGERLMAYNLDGPARLWEDAADAGFHEWQRHGNTVVMAAEMELAAWDIHGSKLWTTFVEPPWEYYVDGNTIHLDVLGVLSTFPLTTGPTTPPLA